jgi:hypothetical protein
VCGFTLRTPLNARLQAIEAAAVAAAVQQELSIALVISQMAGNASNTGRLSAPANLTANGSAIVAGNTTGALESWNSTGTAARPAAGYGSEVVGVLASVAGMFVDTGGPSCRPTELLDLRSGVVNYGC